MVYMDVEKIDTILGLQTTLLLSFEGPAKFSQSPSFLRFKNTDVYQRLG